MGAYWIWPLVVICSVVINAGNGTNGGNNEAELDKAAKNIDRLIDELTRQTAVTFNGNEKVINDAFTLVTFGRVCDYYENLLNLSKSINRLEKEKTKKNAKESDRCIDNYNSQIGQITKWIDSCIRELTHLLSGKQDVFSKLYDVINNEEKLRSVQSKLPKLTKGHVSKWKQLKDLKKNVEALKKRDAYQTLSKMEQVEKYLEEYEKARKLTNCTEYILKRINSICADSLKMKILSGSLSVGFFKTRPMKLGVLKKKLQGSQLGVAGQLYSHICVIKYLSDFTADELGIFGPEQDDITALNAIKILQQKREDQRKKDIIAKIIARMDALREETNPGRHEPMNEKKL